MLKSPFFLAATAAEEGTTHTARATPRPRRRRPGALGPRRRVRGERVSAPAPCHDGRAAPQAARCGWSTVGAPSSAIVSWTNGVTVVRPRAWKRLTNARDVQRSPPAAARTPLSGLRHRRLASWVSTLVTPRVHVYVGEVLGGFFKLRFAIGSGAQAARGALLSGALSGVLSLGRSKKRYVI